MKLSVTFGKRYPADRRDIEIRLESQIKRYIVPHLTGIAAERSEIEAVVRKLGHGKSAYLIKLRIYLPPKTILVSENRAEESGAAVDKAVKSLLSKIVNHIDRVRRQESQKRNMRRTRLQNYRAHQKRMPSSAVNDASAVIEELLPRLEHAVKRELAFLHYQGDLPPDYPTLQDVLDEVVAASIADWKPGMDSHGVYHRLLKEMHKVLDKEVQASRTFGEMVSLEEPALVNPSDQAGNMIDEEFYEFWQPDELLRIEDMIAGEVSENAAASARDEQKIEYTIRLLKDLPNTWRRTLMMHELDHISEHDLTEILDLDLSTVFSCIGQADHFIRARLREAGFEDQSGSLLSGFGKGEAE